jgi:prepilin signal peptidase PulO-like enzyme (type II secretory pathway)
VQLFAAIAALVPTLAGFPAISTPFGFSVGLVPAAVFFASVLAMLPVGLAIAVSRLAARADMRQQLAHDIASTVPMSIASGIGFGALAILAQRFALAWPLVLAAGILFVFLPSRIRLVAAIALGISGLALDPFGLLVWSADSAAAVLLIGIAFRIGRTKTLFRSRKKVTDLVEGDVVATDIVEHDGKIELRETDAIQTVINHLKPKDTKTGERVVWSGYQTNGLEESDLATLHALADAKRIPDTLWVKETTPFVPAILAGFALTILFGAWIWKTMGL